MSITVIFEKEGFTALFPKGTKIKEIRDYIGVNYGVLLYRKTPKDIPIVYSDPHTILEPNRTYTFFYSTKKMSQWQKIRNTIRKFFQTFRKHKQD